MRFYFLYPFISTYQYHSKASKQRVTAYICIFDLCQLRSIEMLRVFFCEMAIKRQQLRKNTPRMVALPLYRYCGPHCLFFPSKAAKVYYHARPCVHSRLEKSSRVYGKTENSSSEGGKITRAHALQQHPEKNCEKKSSDQFRSDSCL